MPSFHSEDHNRKRVKRFFRFPIQFRNGKGTGIQLAVLGVSFRLLVHLHFPQFVNRNALSVLWYCERILKKQGFFSFSVIF